MKRWWAKRYKTCCEKEKCGATFETGLPGFIPREADRKGAAG
jgi:hypothetical protein